MPVLKFALYRFGAALITFLVITMALYGLVLLVTPEERAMLYLPPNSRANLPERLLKARINAIIRQNGFNDPYMVQYGRWLGHLAQGSWGYSPVLNDNVAALVARRLPVTVELTLYTLLVMIPAGLLGGVIAGWRPHSRRDRNFQAIAFLVMSLPPYVLGLILLSIFYVGLNWFAPGRTDIIEITLRSSTFRHYTGLLTVDGVLNGRLDVTLNAFRHLVLPVITVGLAHWAILGRVTRVAMIDERRKAYIMAARARGASSPRLAWRHAFRNVLPISLTSSTLTAASLITSVYIIEAIFNLKGLSELLIRGMMGTPDIGLAISFAVCSIILVLPLMTLLDILKAWADPRIGEMLA